MDGALSLALSCPDGSVSRLYIKMGSTLTSGNDEYVNLHPFPLPHRHLWSAGEGEGGENSDRAEAACWI